MNKAVEFCREGLCFCEIVDEFLARVGVKCWRMVRMNFDETKSFCDWALFLFRDFVTLQTNWDELPISL